MLSHKQVISARSLIFDANPLTEALIRRDKQRVKALLDFGYNVQIGSGGGFLSSPFFYAIQMADVEVLKWFLKKNICFKNIDHSIETPFGLAYKIGNPQITKLILQVYINERFNPTDYRQFTPFHVACALGNLKIVKRFLRFGYFVNHCINLDTLSHSGFSPLHFAIDQNKVSVVKLLLVRGADFTLEDGNGQSPFYLACKQNRKSIVNLLVPLILRKNINSVHHEKGFSLYCEDFFNIMHSKKRAVHADAWSSCSPLHVAAIRRNRKVIEFLLDKNANVNAKNCYGFTPLHFVCQSIVSCDLSRPVNSIEIQDILVNNINFVTDTENQIKIVKLFSKYNVDMNITNEDGETPIYFVIRRYVLESSNFSQNVKMRLPNLFSKTKELIYVLLKGGANVKIPQTHTGKTILHMLSTIDATTKVEKEILEMVLKAGAEVNIENLEHKSPLYTAADRVCINTLKILLKYSRTGSIDCLFALAVPTAYLKDNDYICILNIIMEKGIDINEQNFKGQNALHAAVNVPFYDDIIEIYEGDQRVLALLRYGCEIDTQDEYGKTPLHYAAANRHVLATVALLNWGANINIEDKHGKTFLSYVYKNRKENNHQYLVNIANFVMIVRNHINKLQCLKLPVNRKNMDDLLNLEAFCYSVLNIKIPNVHAFLNLCEDEIVRMKKIRIDKFTCLYNILFNSANKMAVHVQNNNLNSILDSDNFENEFSLYGSMLKMQREKGLMFKKLLVPATKSLINLSQRSLPDLCVNMIFKYFRASDLQRLINTQS